MSYESEHRHRTCISVALMRRDYEASFGYSICDAKGQPNPQGLFAKKPNGKIISIEPICDHPEDGACPFGGLSTGVTKKDDVLERLDKVIEVLNRNTAQ